MALDASTSLGAAIGLTGEPKDYNFTPLAQRQQQMSQQKIAKAADQEKKKADEERKNLRALEVKPGLHLPSRTDEVLSLGKDYYGTIREVVAEGKDPMYDPRVQEKRYAIIDRFGKLKQERDDATKDLLTASSKPKDYTFDENIYKVISSNNQQPFGSDVYVAGTGLKFNGDIPAQLNKYGKSIGQNIDITQFLDANGNIKYDEYKQVLDSKNQEYASLLLNQGLSGNNEYAALMLKQARNKVMQDPLYELMPDADKEAKIKTEFLSMAINGLKSGQVYSEAHKKTPTPEARKSAFRSGSGGSMQNDIYRLLPSPTYVVTGKDKSGKDITVPDEIVVNTIAQGEPKEIRVNVVDESSGKPEILEVQGSVSRWKYVKGKGYQPYINVPDIDPETFKKTGTYKEYRVVDDQYNSVVDEVGMSPWDVVNNLGGHKTKVLGKGQAAEVKPNSADVKKTIKTKIQSTKDPKKFKVTYTDGTSEIITE